MLTHGFFISLEGGEGAGKSTQAQLLAAHYRAQGIEVLLTREPGGCLTAEALREPFLQHDYLPLSELMILSAARHEHVHYVIQPALQARKMVICDRYIDSTRVYQRLRGVEPAVIEHITALVCGQCMPHQTIIYQLSASAQQQRLQQRTSAANRFDCAQGNFHRQVYQAFADLAAHNPQRCHVVDAANDIETVLQHTIAAIDAKIRLTQGATA